MKNYILLVIIALGILTSCTLRKGVSEGDWMAYKIDINNDTIRTPIDFTINESKIYWDVYYTVDDSIIRFEVEEKEDSLFLTNTEEEIRFKFLSRNQLKGTWTKDDKHWYFEANHLANY